MKTLNEDKVWVFDTGDDIPSGPYSSEAEAWKDIKIMTARNGAGERIECSDPYEMERDRLTELYMKYMDESDLNESMNKSQQKKFYARLNTEKIHFIYIKKDGSERKAYGTLIPEELPPPKKTTDTKQEARNKFKRKFPKDSVLYFDLDEKGFRSFKIQNFVKVIEK